MSSASKARLASLTALNAALYASLSLATAYLPTPFIIQFRPAVVVPAVFAALYGALVGGLGAAVGTFIASIMRYGTPLLTLFSGTPGNFVCFYIVGFLTRKFQARNRWIVGYLAGCVLGLLAGFTVIAVGLYFLATVVGLEMLAKWTSLPFILTALVFGIASELPFMVLLGIPIVEAVRRAGVTRV